MRIDIENAVLSIWLYDSKNEISKLSDLTEDLFSDKIMFNKIKEYKESGNPYDIPLMTSKLGSAITTQIIKTIGEISNIYSYNSYLSELKNLKVTENISKAVANNDINIELLQEQVKILQKNITYEKPVFNFMRDYNQYIDEVDRRIKGEFERYKTGIEALDRKLGYILPGYLIVIGGLHGTGKTNFSVKIMDNLTSENMSCLYISSEMSPASLIDKIVSQQIEGLSTTMLKDGRITNVTKVTEVINKMIYKPINILETGNFNMEKIGRYIDDIKPKIMFIDYIQMFYLEINRGDNRASAMSEIARQLKALAIDKNIVVIALSQVNSEGQMKDSRGISEKADVEILLEDKKEETEFYKTIKLVITKNRFGVTGTMKFKFSKENCDFKIDLSEEEIAKQSNNTCWQNTI